MNLAESIRRHHSAPALISAAGDVALSYDDLSREVDRCAEVLSSRWNRPLVFLHTTSTIETVVFYLACLKLHWPVALVEPREEITTELVATYQPECYLAPAEVNPPGDYSEAAELRGGWKAYRSGAEREKPMAAELQLLLMTSGSTGGAKLVRLSHRNITANAESIASYLDIQPGQRSIQSLPLQYSYGLSLVNSHLLAGGTVVLTPHSYATREFWDDFDRYRCTSFAGVPYTYETLQRMNFSPADHPSLRVMTQAGGGLDTDLKRHFLQAAVDAGVKFFVMYGQTEATARISYVPPDRLADNLQSIGTSIPGGELWLEPVEEDSEIQELIYSGPNVMLGYAACADDLALGDELQGVLRTGDLAIQDEQGYFMLRGRLKRIAKLYGKRISLEDVEHRIQREWSLTSMAVQVDGRLRVLIASEAEGEAIPVRDDLAEWLDVGRSSIEIVQAARLPVNSNGKKDFSRLTAWRPSDLSPEAWRLATTEPPPGELDIRGLFRQVLGVNEVPPDATFITLGGSSLSYVEFSLRLERLLGYLPEGWENLTAGELQSLEPHQGLLARCEVGVILRALAIVGVVVNHAEVFAKGLLNGGAFLLLIIAGANLARFQGAAIRSGRVLPAILSLLKNLVIPYLLLAIAYQIWRRDFNPAVLLLVSNFISPHIHSIFPIWFIQVLAQCLLVFVVLVSIPAIRRLVDRGPWRFGMALVLVSVGIRASAPLFWDTESLYDRVPHMHLWLFAVGWCMQFADNWRKRLVTSAALLFGIAVAGYAPMQMKFYWISVGGLLLLWIDSVPAPRWAKVIVQPIAAAAYYIFLTHGIVFFFLDKAAPAAPPLVAATAAIVCGVAVHSAVSRLGWFWKRRPTSGQSFRTSQTMFGSRKGVETPRDAKIVN